MSLPPAVEEALREALGPVLGAHPIAGGCINPALCVDTPRGRVFVKYNESSPSRMFVVEAAGLEALAGAADAPRVPRVIAASEGGDRVPAWLALEWLQPATRSSRFEERVGRGLAALHRHQRGGWGWHEEGYIGPLPQPNSSADSWADFWWYRRLEPQLALARAAGRCPGSARQWDLLATQLPDLLAVGQDEGASLLHGDLWGGNVIALPSGEPALVDPAAYRGHREVDLAMTELFGGFGPEFYGAYREIWPLRAGYHAVRKHVYQLYYLLVHVNLFGSGYRARTEDALERAIAGN